jgi:hypothetical protein
LVSEVPNWKKDNMGEGGEATSSGDAHLSKEFILTLPKSFVVFRVLVEA